MMPSTQKSARSRFSSPLHVSSSPASYNKGVTTEGQRKFLQRWLEPPLQNKPSFQEAGLVRGGVVENMAPLGTLPKQAKKQTPVGGGDGTPAPGPAVKKIVLKKSAALRATPVDMDESAFPPRATIESPDRQSFSPTRPVFPVNGLDDEDDDDYTPVPKKSTKSRRSSGGNGAGTGPGAGGSAARPVRVGRRSNVAHPKSPSPSPSMQTPMAEIIPQPSLPAASSQNSQPSCQSPQQRSQRSYQTPQPQLQMAPEPHQDQDADVMLAAMPSFNAPPSVQRQPDNKELVDKAVEVAVEEALRHYRYPTAYAIRNLYDDYHHDPHFVSMFEDVFHQRADIDALTEFNRLMTARKKDGSADNKGFHYWVPPAGASQPAFQNKPRPAPYTALLTMDLTPAKTKSKSVDLDYHVHKKVKLEDQQESAAVTASSALADALLGPLRGDGDFVGRGEARSPTPSPAPGPVRTHSHALTGVSATVPAVMKSEPASATASIPAQPSVKVTINGTHGKKHANGVSAVNGVEVEAPMVKAHKSSPHKSPHKSPGKGKKRQRSQSVSSDSSLSSVPDDALINYDEFMDQVDEELGVSRPSTAEPNDAPAPASSSQPIKARQKRPATKKKKQSPGVDPSSGKTTTTTTAAAIPATTAFTTNHRHPSLPTQDLDMPAAIAVNGASHPRKQKPFTPARLPPKSAEPDDARHLIEKKVVARQGTHQLTKDSVADSLVRIPLASDSLDDQLPVLAPVGRPRNNRTPAPPVSLRAARAAKRHNEGADEASSPTAALRFDFEPPSSARSSRAATPSNPRTTKKQRVGLRVKTSPMKKKATSAGIPRGSGERPSPVLGGPQHDKDENDDSCFTCGGSGELVCCDGCNYSFHFLCIDPPMDENVMPDDWYCNECVHKFFPEKLTGHRGAFGTLLDALDKKNPRAFRLPLDIREYFEGVKTGVDGEYEEATSSKPKPIKKGPEEAFDFFRVRSTEGTAVLCHQCHQGVTSSRPIIPCSVCGLNWHLDCLDPPLAVPPVLRNWRCPCHVEDAFMKNLAPAHKYRKTKNTPVIEQAYSRGMRNNGWIEVEEDDDDELEDTWTATRRDFGRVYRLPEKGIKLDFIARVHENRAKSSAPTTRAGSSHPALSLATRSVEEHQAALNLAQLAGRGDGVDRLVDVLIANAPPDAVSLMAAGDATHLNSQDLNQLDANSLQAMLAQVDQMRTKLTQLLGHQAAATAQRPISQTSQGREDGAMQVD